MAKASPKTETDTKLVEEMAADLAKNLGLAKNPRALTEDQRIAKVFVSQGLSERLAENLPAKYRKRVAALADEHGTVLPAAVKEFANVHREWKAEAQEQKATVDGLEDDK